MNWTKLVFNPESLNFLKAIRAAPDDNLPRLIYSDWLEEHGESYYADFIRRQCGGHDRIRTDPNGSPTLAEVTEFFVKRQYVDVLFPQLAGNYKLARGFISEVDCSVDVLKKNWAMLRQTQPDFLINLNWINFQLVSYWDCLDQYQLNNLSMALWDTIIPAYSDFRICQLQGPHILRKFMSDALTKWLDYAEYERQKS